MNLVDARVILWEGETKGGSRRVVDLPPATLQHLKDVDPKSRKGHVFLNNRGEPYRTSDNGGGQMKKAWAGATCRAGIKGYTPHHLRHTWASCHYALHKDLLKLQKEGGWDDMRSVVRYAHIMPGGHDAAILACWGAGVSADVSADEESVPSPVY